MKHRGNPLPAAARFKALSRAARIRATDPALVVARAVSPLHAWQDQAYKRGFASCAANLPEHANPYPPNTCSNASWCKGWEQRLIVEMRDKLLGVD